MSAGRSTVGRQLHPAYLLPLHARRRSRRSRIPYAALFFLAAILLLSRGSGLQSNLGAVALLQCGLLAGAPAPGCSGSSLAPWPVSAPLLLRGVAAYRSGRVHTALPLFEQARAAHPSDPLALFWLASAAFRSGDTASAVHAWKTLGPRKMAAFFTARAQGALGNRDALSALELAQVAVEVDPTCGKAALQLGRVYLQRGDLQAAGTTFQKALGLQLNTADRAAAYHALGEIDRALGHGERALGEYRQAVDFAPETYLYRRDLADQYARLHHYPEANAVLLALLAGHPSDPSLQVRLGNLDLDRNEYAAAEWWYRAAVSADPGSGAGEAALGRLYRQKGDLVRAAAFFRESIARNPDLHWVSAALGGVYWQQGRLDEAIAAYEWVTVHSPDPLLLAESRRSLAQLYALTGKNTPVQPAPPHPAPLYSAARPFP